MKRTDLIIKFVSSKLNFQKTVTFRGKAIPAKAVAISAVCVLALTTAGVAALAYDHQQTTAAHYERAATLTKQQKTASSNNNASPAPDSDSKQQGVSNSSTSIAQQPGIQDTTKYVASSDPKPAAYTPPAPEPADFMTKITRSNQVSPGTLIASNTVKRHKCYYGGDLIISQSEITLSKSTIGEIAARLTVAIPDGAISNVPSEVWYERPSFVFQAYDSSSNMGPGTNWTTKIVASSTAPNGTYTVHMSTVRVGQSNSSWQYDGFVTVHIVD